MRKLTAVFAITCCAAASTVRGQCRPGKGSNEARLLAFYSAPIAFSPASAPEYQPPWAFRIGAEGGLIPAPDPQIQKTGICRINRAEKIELSRFFARPRLTLTLPGHFAIEATYVPPIRINESEPNLGSLAISKTLRIRREDMGNPTSAMVRLHGTAGRVRGPISCPAKSLQQTSAEQACFGTTPSKDTFKPTMLGLEGILSTAAYDGRMGFYAGGGVNFLRPRFEAGFTDGLGDTDNTQVEADLTRAVIIGGVSVQASTVLDLSAQVYSVRRDVTTLRFGAGYHLETRRRKEQEAQRQNLGQERAEMRR